MEEHIISGANQEIIFLGHYYSYTHSISGHGHGDEPVLREHWKGIAIKKDKDCKDKTGTIKEVFFWRTSEIQKPADTKDTGRKPELHEAIGIPANSEAFFESIDRILKDAAKNKIPGPPRLRMFPEIVIPHSSIGNAKSN